MAFASFRTFGEETAWTLRLPFAASGLAMGLGVLLLLAPALRARTELRRALASLTTAAILQKPHLAKLDVPLAAGAGIAVAGQERPEEGAYVVFFSDEAPGLDAVDSLGYARVERKARRGYELMEESS